MNGLYTHVRLKYNYPIGEHKEIVNPPPNELPNLFGLIKATVFDEGKVPLGIPYKDSISFNRIKGKVPRGYDRRVKEFSQIRGKGREDRENITL